MEEREGGNKLWEVHRIFAFPEEGDERLQGILALKLQDTPGGIF